MILEKTWTIQQLFRFLDHNNDGLIDARDLVAACMDPNAPSTMDQVTLEGLRQLQTASTVRLSYTEFAHLMDRHAIPNSDMTAEHIGKVLTVVAHATTQAKTNMMSDTMKHLIAGGLAGAVSRTVVSPMERMKILFQVQGPEPAVYEGVFPTLAKMWREEGLMGFMRGNGTNVVRIIPYSASQFASYEYFKAFLMEPGKSELDTSRRLTAGGLAGVVSVACTYPLDMVRTRLSIQSATLQGNSRNGGQHKKLPGIVPTMMQIYRTEGGWFGLYRGLWPTTLGVAPYVALNFQCYEGLKAYMIPPNSDQPSTTRKLICGALAGSIAQTITYPLDVLRRRMQVTGMASMEYKYTGTWDAIRTMIQKEGVKSMYKGLIPNYLKVAPAIGVSFVTYEWCKDAMQPL
ncbi:hypothetical protein DFQ29_004837 [Apophysomyces sp. BC1021]|nr:hypothetical protein DFQ29_004837 [Apophysomyces sp. BC1021]